LVGKAGKRGGRSRHGLGITAGIVPARHLAVHTLHELPSPTGDTPGAIAAEPADRHPVAHGEALDTLAKFGHRSRYLVAQRQRPAHVRKATGDETVVGAAHTTRGD